MEKEKINKKPADFDLTFSRFQERDPQPHTELDYENPFTLLVSVVLSAQATDMGVNKVTPGLFALADSPEKMVALGEEKVQECVKSINYFRTKAKNIVRLSQLLIDNFESKVPETLELLMTLPGVGRKTANVVLSCAFKHATIAVDTHVLRVANRLGWADTPSHHKAEHILMEKLPLKWLPNAHHWMVLHGRYICKARRPLCETCFLTDTCPSQQLIPL